ncbi:uncharacterized protein LOC125939857 [Dermacentor silvarum]|uniref:uncharacterized protein LOC125939857 n=1 Tax=Dermacentor silvarum TaxID=543639 RepID=UPI002101D02D|nr:uncharacterized protein LOC125939857 [Dermacentor silvarum]
MRHHLCLPLYFCLAAYWLRCSSANNVKTPPKPIGVGITLDARVFYDKTVKLEETLSESTGKNTNNPAFKKFKEIFAKVHQEFKTSSVMVNFVVRTAKLNDNLSVPFENMTQAVDGEKTLENLLEFARTKTVSNNSVFYFFTNRSILKESGKKHETDQVPVERFEMNTRGTFCSTNASAAVVSIPNEALGIDFAARATAFVFGSTRYKSFTRSDRRYMNETFL